MTPTKQDVNQLKFDTEEEALTVLSGLYPTEDGYAQSSPTHDIFIVPPIIETAGEYDEETGEVIKPTVYVQGFHVDVIDRNGLPDALKEYLVTPSPVTPSHEVAGL